MEGYARYEAVQTIVFDVGGQECTDITAKAAVARARALGIGHLVVASTSGWTGSRVLAAAKEAGYGGKVVVVGEHMGYEQERLQQMAAEMRQRLEAKGATVHIATHAFSSIARSFRLRWGGIEMGEIVAETLRRVSRGTKVGCEISIMAADAGLVPTDRDVVAMGGSGRGCDTAIVVRPATMNRFFDLKVREFIAIPRLRVAEVMAPAVRRTKAGESAEAIAAELRVDPSLVRSYTKLHEDVMALVAAGATMDAALGEAAGWHRGEVSATFKELFGKGR